MTQIPKTGEAVYTEDGVLVGRIERVDADGIHLVPAGEAEGVTTTLVGGAHGEADLVWRCGACGEVGEIATMPDRCPNCGAPREEIYYLTQD